MLQSIIIGQCSMYSAEQQLEFITFLWNGVRLFDIKFI